MPPATSPESLVDALIESYRADARAQHIGKRFIPSRSEIVEILNLVFQLLYPGYHGRQDLNDENLAHHVGALVRSLTEKLHAQIECCLCFLEQEAGSSDLPKCRRTSAEVTGKFLERLPELRRQLVLDAQAALEGDPAAVNMDEIILAYPGMIAITVYRVAHELLTLGVPLMPRIMTEWAHSNTGADIHPGAEIGDRFFIDHATGVVVRETRIGSRVKLYQGVTLGALSLPRGTDGRLVRGTKRHPTVGDDVTVYANATVLGGETILGNGSVVGGSVFVTKSVPEGHRVALDPPKLRMAPANPIEFEI